MTIYLYPNRFTRDFKVRKSIEEGQQLEIRNHKVLNDFLNEILDRNHPGPRKPREITTLCKYMVIKDIVTAYYQNHPEGMYAQLCDFVGFVKVIKEVISTLQRNVVEPNQFAAAGEKLGNPKVTEIAELYKTYQDKLGIEYTEEQHLNFLHLQALETHLADSMTGNHIILRGFRKLTPLYKKIFKTMERSGYKLRIELDDLASHLLPRGSFDTVNLETKPPYYGAAKALLGLDTREETEELPELTLMKALSQRKEIRALAGKIRLLIDEGIYPSRICLVFRELEEYTHLVDEIFRGLNIPYYYRRGNPLRFIPITRTILFGLQIIRDNNLKNTDLFKLLQSNFISLDGFGVPGESHSFTDELEDYAFNTGLYEGNRDYWHEKIDGHIMRIDVTNEQEKYGVIIKGIVDFLFDINTPKSFTEHLNHVKTFLKRFGIIRNTTCDVEESAILNSSALGEFLNAMQNIEKSWQQYQELGQIAATQIDYTEFMDYLNMALENLNVNMNHQEENAVYILNAEDVKNLEFDYLFLAGMVEKQFPKLPPIHPLFNEGEDKKSLNEFLGDAIFETKAQKIRWERYLFGMCLNACQEKLCISHTCMEDDGKEIPQSYFLGELIDTYKKNMCKDKINFDRSASYLVTLPIQDCITFEEFGNCLFDLLFGAGISHNQEDQVIANNIYNYIKDSGHEWRNGKRVMELLKIAAIEKQREQFFRHHRFISSFVGDITSGNITAIPGMLRSKLLDRGDEKPVSFWTQGKVSDYAKCPFKFFCGRILRAKPVEFLKDEINQLNIGLIYHEIFEYFYRSVIEKNIPREEWGELMKVVASEQFQEARDHKYLGWEKLWEIQKQKILRDCEFFVEYEKVDQDYYGYRPVELEWKFGGSSLNTPAYSFNEEYNFSFAGRIDRIDEKYDEDGECVGFRIIDYKSGTGVIISEDKLKEKIEQLHDFQLILYMKALMERYKLDPSVLCGGFEAAYYRLKNLHNFHGKYKAKGVFPIGKSNSTAAVLISLDYLENRDLFEGLGLKLKELVEDAVRGRYRVDPVECEDYCEFKYVCRYEGAHVSEEDKK